MVCPLSLRPLARHEPFVDTHGHNVGSHVSHGPEGELINEQEKTKADVESQSSGNPMYTESAMAQIIGVAILEFGVVLHR